MIQFKNCFIKPRCSMAGFTNSLETSFGRWVIGYTIYPSKICEKLCTPNNKWKLIEKKENQVAKLVPSHTDSV